MQNNMVINDSAIINATKKTHGDFMIEFAIKYAPNIEIYYDDATNSKDMVHRQ